MQSTQAGPSLAAVWVSGLVMYWNLRLQTQPDADPLAFLPFMVLGCALPALLGLGARRLLSSQGSGERRTR